MRLRNLIAENPNYSEDSKTALFKNKIETAASDKYDWLIEFRVQRIIESRLKVVIDKTPHDVLSFAQSEVHNIKGLFENNLNKTERSIYCNGWSISEFTNYSDGKTWEVDVVTRYKQYLEMFIVDDCIIEADQPVPDDEELIFKEFFSSLEEQRNNIVIEYRYVERGYKEETYGEYSVISISDCHSPAMFLAKINNYAGEGISNLKTKIRSVKKQTEKQQLINEVKQMAHKYKDVIVNGYFQNAKFQGNVGWQLAFNDDAQVSIQQKIPDFIKAWDTGISELLQKIIFIEVNPQDDKPMPVVDKQILSFEYKNNNTRSLFEVIDDLLDSLKKDNFIDALTTKPKFRSIFAEKQIADKVIWIGGINTLRYFILKLVDNGKIDNDTNYWKIAQLCFSNKGKDFTTEQLKQAKIPAQKKVDIIDRLTSNL